MMSTVVQVATAVRDDQQIFVRYALERPHLVSLDIDNKVRIIICLFYSMYANAILFYVIL
jgi:hypothetical protein